MIVRTKFIDEHLQHAVADGVRQVVILGAGFDSRAFRFRQLLRNVKVFEVDFGPTQEFKRRRVRDVLGEPPSNVIFVPIDFTRQKLGAVLRRAGYRTDRRTLFIWEGVTMYIPEEAIRETLRFIAGNSGDGSSVVFNYMSKRAIDVGTQQNVGLFAMVKGWGEPWVFGLPEGAEPEFFTAIDPRLQLVEYLLISGPEAMQCYLTRKDGTRVWDLPRQSPFMFGRPESWLAVVTVAPKTKTR
jgi:methyltransferase (TIGR00027 family)